MRKVPLVRWVLFWAWYTVHLALVFGTVSFLSFRYGQPLVGVIVLVVAILLIIVAIVARARDLKNARERAAARRAAATEVSRRP